MAWHLKAVARGGWRCEPRRALARPGKERRGAHPSPDAASRPLLLRSQGYGAALLPHVLIHLPPLLPLPDPTACYPQRKYSCARQRVHVAVPPLAPPCRAVVKSKKDNSVTHICKNKQ